LAGECGATSRAQLLSRYARIVAPADLRCFAGSLMVTGENEFLLDLLRREKDVRRIAILVEVISKDGNLEIPSDLLTEFMLCPDPQLRDRAMGIVSRLSNPGESSLIELLGILDESDRTGRALALMRLGACAGPAGISELLCHSTSSAADVRFASILGLAKCGSSELTEDLLRLVSTKSETTRLASQIALASIADRRASAVMMRFFSRYSSRASRDYPITPVIAGVVYFLRVDWGEAGRMSQIRETVKENWHHRRGDEREWIEDKAPQCVPGSSSDRAHASPDGEMLRAALLAPFTLS
jgi:hypothetical protein